MSSWSKVDLHLHSTASDGTLSPAELVALAVQRGLRVIALTDHDSTEGVDAALQAARASGGALEVVPGVELNTDVPAGEAHVLGYLLDHHDQALQEELAQRRASRLERGRAMVEKLARLGLPVSWQRVLELAGSGRPGMEGAVGRPHVAQAMVEQGYVATVQEAFEKYLGRHGPAYVERDRLTPAEAVAAITRAGGLPVLAHPPSWPEYERHLPALIEAGLVGLECYYGVLPPETVGALVATARAFGLVATGGSDFHGPNVLPGVAADLGGVPVPLEAVQALKELKARRRAGIS
jgi:predicted metal-dependent phosphoesterase TrpH